MSRNRWLLAVSTLILFGSVGRVLLNPIVSRGADRRIASEDLPKLEEQFGTRLYAPTWLPYGGHVGTTGTMKGARRILQDFSDQQDRSILIMAQERRTAERDQYHAGKFASRAEAKALVKGSPAYFVTGASGERRLFWNEPETAVIISSTVLNDRELLEVAQKVR
jgi:hypothetical protein